MRVLVLWADDSSPNLGVRALARGTAALVRSVWPDAIVEFQNYGSRIPHLPIGRIRSLLVERVFGRRGMQDWFRTFDLIVDSRSGDSFADIYGLHRLAVMSIVGEFAAQSGVPVVLGPQTIGPFTTRRGLWFARLTLRSSSLVLARDSGSEAVARSILREAVVSASDVVFALPVPVVARSRDVILNVSGLLWHPNPHVDHLDYRRTVERLHHELVARGRTVSILAHVIGSGSGSGSGSGEGEGLGHGDSDSTVARQLAAALGAELIEPTSLDDVRDAVASANLVIGSRMHACLNALSVGTPAIPLAYSDKFAPLLDDLGWPFSIDLRTATDPVETALRFAETASAADVIAVRGLAAAALDNARLALAAVPL